MNISLNEFNAYVSKLATHDWQYDYSEEGRVRRKGAEANKALTSQATTNPLLQEAYSTYSACEMSSTGSLLQRIERREKAIEHMRKQVWGSQLQAA